MRTPLSAGNVASSEDQRARMQVEGAVADDSGDMPSELVVEGIAIKPDSTLAVMRSACGLLGLGKSGGKAKVYKRLCEHVKKMELMMKHRALSQAKAATHEPTHLPFKEWCEFCVANKARSDRRSAVESGRSADPDNKLIALCLHDRHTGWRGAIPTNRKGGAESTKYLVGEGVQKQGALYELCMQAPYQGKIVGWGECVLGLCRTSVKRAPKWVKGLWLGKVNQNDCRVLSTAGGS